MNMLREYLNRPLFAAAAGFVLGLIIGLFALGWGLFPVEWKDASPALLREDVQQDYLRMAIDSYTKNQDATLAIKRFDDLGKGADEILAAVQADPRTLSQSDISIFAAAVQSGLAGLPPAAVTPSVNPLATLAATQSSTAVTPKKSILPVVLGVICGLGLLIAAGIGYVYFSRNRTGRSSAAEMADEETEVVRPPARKSSESASREQPVAQFMTTYMAGDDLYDDLFSIDSPSGEFLGECGVGISETVGVGDPKKVTAFEVWLFDKNDIQTVTKVLMSAHAFEDPAILQRLESKGEPVLAEPGKHVVLETATLILEARVVDMNYGKGALPSSSFFDRLTLELAVWPKA